MGVMTGEWEATEHSAIQVRAVIVRQVDVIAKKDMVLVGQQRLVEMPGPVVSVRGIEPSIAGYMVRVFSERNHGEWACKVCGGRVKGFRKDGQASKHTCGSRAPWIPTKPSDGSSWYEQHRASPPEPVLYATRQLAYAAGLDLVGEDTNTIRDWSWNGVAA